MFQIYETCTRLVRMPRLHYSSFAVRALWFTPLFVGYFIRFRTVVVRCSVSERFGFIRSAQFRILIVALCVHVYVHIHTCLSCFICVCVPRSCILKLTVYENNGRGGSAKKKENNAISVPFSVRVMRFDLPTYRQNVYVLYKRNCPLNSVFCCFVSSMCVCVCFVLVLLIALQPV